MWDGLECDDQRNVTSCAIAPMTQVYQLGWTSCLRDQMNDLYQDIHGQAAESQCVTSQRLLMRPQESTLPELAAVSSQRYLDYQACCLECLFRISKHRPPQCHFPTLELRMEPFDADYGLA